LQYNETYKYETEILVVQHKIIKQNLVRYFLSMLIQIESHKLVCGSEYVTSLMIQEN